MGELGALFNPGMRHELEERQSKAARREEEGNARDGDLRIDLESGVAVINIPGDDDDQPATDDAGSDDDDDDAPKANMSEAVKSEAVKSDAAQSEPAAPPVLRPRGKRGLSASHR